MFVWDFCRLTIDVLQSQIKRKTNASSCVIVKIDRIVETGRNGRGNSRNRGRDTRLHGIEGIGRRRLDPIAEICDRGLHGVPVRRNHCLDAAHHAADLTADDRPDGGNRRLDSRKHRGNHRLNRIPCRSHPGVSPKFCVKSRRL